VETAEVSPYTVLILLSSEEGIKVAGSEAIRFTELSEESHHEGGIYTYMSLCLGH